MREKLLNLMKEENLTSSRLAELLGIQPSGISHILKGRNNPSLDFIQKILRRFPQINPDWLIMGEGEMYRNKVAASEQGDRALSTQQISAGDDSGEFGQGNGNGNSSERQLGFSTSQTAMQTGENSNSQEKSKSIVSIETTQTAQEISQIIETSPKRRISRVIILFEDRTFESYEMGR